MLKENPAERIELRELREELLRMASLICLEVVQRKVQHHKTTVFQLPKVAFHASTVSKSHSNSFSKSDWSL
jgi:hypothetical protein